MHGSAYRVRSPRSEFRRPFALQIRPDPTPKIILFFRAKTSVAVSSGKSRLKNSFLAFFTARKVGQAQARLRKPKYHHGWSARIDSLSASNGERFLRMEFSRFEPTNRLATFPLPLGGEGQGEGVVQGERWGEVSML